MKAHTVCVWQRHHFGADFDLHGAASPALARNVHVRGVGPAVNAIKFPRQRGDKSIGTTQRRARLAKM